MNQREPLTNRQIGLLLYINRKGGELIYLGNGLRPLAVTLWRRSILQVWYRQDESGLVGPYFHLTFTGRKLAQVFVARRRVQLLPLPEAA